MQEKYSYSKFSGLHSVLHLGLIFSTWLDGRKDMQNVNSAWSLLYAKFKDIKWAQNKYKNGNTYYPRLVNEILKTRYWTFPVAHYFTWNIKFFSHYLHVICSWLSNIFLTSSDNFHNFKAFNVFGIFTEVQLWYWKTFKFGLVHFLRKIKCQNITVFNILSW